MAGILTMLTAVVAIIGAATLLFRPMWAFLLVILLFAVEQVFQSYFSIFVYNPALFNYLVAFIAALALFLRICRRDAVFSGMNNPVTYLVFAQFALWLMAILYSQAHKDAVESLDASWRYLILFLCLLPLLIVDLAEFRKILIGTMVVGTIIAALIILNPKGRFYGERLMIELGTMGLSKDDYGNPLATAELGGMIALIAALIAPQRQHMLLSVLRVAAFIAGMGLAIGSGSRGQALAACVVGVAFFPLARRLNNPRNFIFGAAGLGVLLAGIYAAFQWFIVEQNRERWEVSRMMQDVTLRWDMCRDFIAEWISKPDAWLLGLGTKSWLAVGGAYNAPYVHNIAVEILCEHGIVGAVIFVITCILCFRAGRQLWMTYREDPTMRSVAAIFLALVAFAFLNSLKQGDMTSGAPFLWLLVLAKVARHERLLLRQPAEAAIEAYVPELPHRAEEYALAR